MRLPLLVPLLLASCAAPVPLPAPPLPPMACDSPAPPPATPAPPRTVERLAHFAIALELSREAANASLVDCADKLRRTQDALEATKGSP